VLLVSAAMCIIAIAPASRTRCTRGILGPGTHQYQQSKNSANATAWGTWARSLDDGNPWSRSRQI